MTMSGMVNELLEGMLRVSVQDASGHAHELDALVDTGFNGFLTLPPKLIAALGLPWLFRQQGQLADGNIQTFDVHEGTISWDDAPLKIEVEAVNAEPLIGMGLLNGYLLRIEVTKDGSVTIDSLS